MQGGSTESAHRDAFDKTAKTLRIPWLPGLGPGPSLEAYALPHPTDDTIRRATDRYLAEIPKFKPAVPRQMAFSFAGLKTQVLKATTKFWPNLQLREGMPEGLKRAVARKFQEVGYLRGFLVVKTTHRFWYRRQSHSWSKK